MFYCLVEAEKCLHKISGGATSGYTNSAEKSMGEIRSKLEFADVSDVINSGLHEYLDDMQLKINKISNEIEDNFFRIKDNFVSQINEQE